MKRLSSYDQHFLRSTRLVAELVGHTNIRKNDLVYDFGAGSGVITSVLVRRAAQVVAVEKEPHALAALRKNLGDVANLKIVSSDILAVELPAEKYKVFANPPFSIISDLVRRLAEASNPPVSIYLISQRQFALKIVPSDKHFTSALGIELAPIYQAKIRKPLRKTDFTPPPAVDTVLLELRRRDEPLVEIKLMKEFRNFVRECFASSIAFQKMPRSEANISPERKPSELSPDEWIRLWHTSRGHSA